ncbi:MAG: peptidylprolyl isomerase [Pseudomonadota bacterium]
MLSNRPVSNILLPLSLLPLSLLAAGASAAGAGCAQDEENNSTVDAAIVDSQPVDSNSHPVVVMETTMGNLVIQLEAELMPQTTANFLQYVDSGFYDGTLIHRVIDDWVIQGGGFSSGLVAKTANAPIALETNKLVTHVNGAISMARTNDPNSATSQWFIVDWPKTGTPPQPSQLDGNYAAFGVLIEGFDVLEAITKVATGKSDVHSDVPQTEIVVQSAHRR